MKGFEDVTLSWKGEDFVVQANRQMMLIAEIEDVLVKPGQQAVTVLLNGPAHSRLARAYGAALRYAGASVTDDEIYLSITADLAEGKADAVVKIQAAVLGLLAIIAPPIARKLTETSEPGEADPAEDGSEQSTD